jgi:hypothetical protein
VLLAFVAFVSQAVAQIASHPPKVRDTFLNEVQRRCFAFFWNEAHPATGIVKDRANNFKPDKYEVGSIAATGFGLAALPIGVERKWVTREQARKRALVTLRFFDSKMKPVHGLYPHFINWKNGERYWKCEYSTIDTALLLCGALTAGEYFGGEVKTLADRLLRKVNWQYWMQDGFISHGYTPEDKTPRMKNGWNDYSESLLLYLLAMGSPYNPVPGDVWDRLRRDWGRYREFSTIGNVGLFTDQYTLLFFDLRGLRDTRQDVWEVLRVNTLLNRRYCADNAGKWKGFDADCWGLTAGDGPDGYKGYSAPPRFDNCDGTLNPHAAGGSYMCTPDLSYVCLRTMFERYRNSIWGRYGFSDGFNPTRDWWGPDVVGIDTGCTLLSIENGRSGLVWRLIKKQPWVRKGIAAAGLKPGKPTGDVLPLAPYFTELSVESTFTIPASYLSAWAGKPVFIYGGVTSDWTTVEWDGVVLRRARLGPRGTPMVAFPVPAARLAPGPHQVTVTISRKEGTPSAGYGPVLLGPREALEFRPLMLDPVSPAAEAK